MRHVKTVVTQPSTIMFFRVEKGVFLFSCYITGGFRLSLIEAWKTELKNLVVLICVCLLRYYTAVLLIFTQYNFKYTICIARIQFNLHI